MPTCARVCMSAMASETVGRHGGAADHAPGDAYPEAVEHPPPSKGVQRVRGYEARSTGVCPIWTHRFALTG